MNTAKLQRMIHFDQIAGAVLRELAHLIEVNLTHHAAALGRVMGRVS